MVQIVCQNFDIYENLVILRENPKKIDGPILPDVEKDRFFLQSMDRIGVFTGFVVII